MKLPIRGYNLIPWALPEDRAVSTVVLLRSKTFCETRTEKKIAQNLHFFLRLENDTSYFNLTMGNVLSCCNLIF